MFVTNLRPGDRQLRQFGAITVIALPLLVWLWTRASETLLWTIPAGLLVAFAAMLKPRLLLPLYLAISIVTLPIGIVIGELCLLCIYFGLIVPIGMCFRLMGRDALQLKSDDQASSFWLARSQPKHVRSYYRQS